MKKKPKRQPPTGKVEGNSVSKWVIFVEEGPLRKRAISKRDRLLAKVSDARRQWDRFQKDDKSAYIQWMAATFGHLLTQLRETYGAIQEKQNLIAEVVEELDSGKARTYREAYARVLDRRANPPTEPPHWEREPGASSSPPEDDEGEPPSPGPSDARAESEEEMLFRVFLQLIMGLSPDDLTPAEYERYYREYQAGEFGDRRSGPVNLRPAPGNKSATNRLKEIYRILVRRLHPDAGNGARAEVSSVWHEVQEAYQQGDLERLEVLLALTETGAEMAGETSSLGRLRGLIAALERELRALQRTITQARRDPAWDFGNQSNRDALARRVRNDMEGELAYQQRLLQEMEKQIQRWAAPVAKKPKPAPPPVRSHPIRPERPSQPSRQSEFNFRSSIHPADSKSPKNTGPIGGIRPGRRHE